MLSGVIQRARDVATPKIATAVVNALTSDLRAVRRIGGFLRAEEFFLKFTSQASIACATRTRNMNETPNASESTLLGERALLDSRILAVDDEPQNILLLERILKRADFQHVISTTDPRRALELFAECKPDIVLTDLLMPELDGVAVMDAIRRRVGRSAFIPIIVLTADATLPTKQRALAAGATDFLTKPFDNLEVVLRIKNHLRVRLLQRQIEEYNVSLEATVSDRTRDLRDALSKLELAQQRLVQSERLSALGTMASGIAHDFNNLLSVILGFGDLLLRDLPQEDKETRRSLETMLTAAEDGVKIVSRLREFQRPPSSEETHTPIDLNKLIDQTVHLTRPRWDTQAAARGVQVRVELECENVPLVSGLSAELREVLTNLIFNAVDAMPGGGTITIRTARREAEVLLQVSDTGAGMTEEIRQRCLEPFFTTKGDHGTGLGLAMVYGVIQRHNGTLDLESELGRGTTFSITLPAAEDVASVESVEGVSAPDRLLHILVVDDEPVLSHLLREFLSNDFHAVEVASNATAALQQFCEGEFDVVITDRNMPGLKGDELARAVKVANPNVPVIMLTGETSDEFDDEPPPHVDVLLAKPISLSGLRNCLARVTKPA